MLANNGLISLSVIKLYIKKTIALRTKTFSISKFLFLTGVSTKSVIPGSDIANANWSLPHVISNATQYKICLIFIFNFVILILSSIYVFYFLNFSLYTFALEFIRFLGKYVKFFNFFVKKLFFLARTYYFFFFLFCCARIVLLSK